MKNEKMWNRLFACMLGKWRFFSVFAAVTWTHFCFLLMLNWFGMNISAVHIRYDPIQSGVSMRRPFNQNRSVKFAEMTKQSSSTTASLLLYHYYYCSAHFAEDGRTGRKQGCKSPVSCGDRSNIFAIFSYFLFSLLWCVSTSARLGGLRLLSYRYWCVPCAQLI